jgi:hypothetical protein
MITPSFALTATERILPRMALDFTTASLDSRVTLARSGNTATCVNSSGSIALVNANLPRFDFNPTTLVCNGLLIEEARTNLLLNSLINGTSLATQLVTTTAVAHTLSFYGTGQIVLTGTSSATVVGTGAYPTRTTLTFTPTAGVLTLTVTGTVQYAQLETASFASSFIPTAASQVTRTADVATMTGTNFSSWFNASEGAFAVQASSTNTSTTNAALLACHNTDANMIDMFNQSNGQLVGRIRANSVTIASMVNGTVIDGATETYAIAYKTASMAVSNKGAAPTTSAAAYSFTVSPNTLAIGANQIGTQQINGYMRKLMFYPQRIINAEVQAFSK